MKEKKVSQTTLAKKLGVTRQTVCEQLKDWENGTEPRISTLKRWAVALEVDDNSFLKDL